MKNIEDVLKLLDHIQENPESTQRELVGKLDISLGRVNFIINALTKKGMIKLKRFKNSKKKRAYLYLITPDGIKEKSLLTREFLIKKMKEYNNLRKQIEALKLALNEHNSAPEKGETSEIIG